jgi:spermidine synthase
LAASDPEFLACEPSPLGMVGLRRRRLPGASEPDVLEITIDHAFLMSSANTVSERALAERALALHAGRDLSVLVGGLGLGYTAAAALGSERVARVEVVELLEPVIGWLARGLVPLAPVLRADPRFALRSGDVYAELAAPPARRSDLILIDVDHAPEEPLGPASAAFYTESGLAAARRHLAADGVLGVWSWSASPAFEMRLRRVFDAVTVEPISFTNLVVGGEETNWLYFARG